MERWTVLIHTGGTKWAKCQFFVHFLTQAANLHWDCVFHWTAAIMTSDNCKTMANDKILCNTSTNVGES